MTPVEAAIRQRAKAAVLGAFVADAATLGLHWIYGADKVQALLEGGRDAAFYEPLSCPFYKSEPGALSPYGDEALFTLQSMCKHGGVDAPSLTQDLADAFAKSTGYVNHVSKQLAANVAAGQRFPEAVPEEEHPQAQSLVKVPLVVARYAGLPELRAKVEEASLSHTRSRAAAQYAQALAAALEQVVLGGRIDEALAGAAAAADAAVQPAFEAALNAPAADVSGIIQAVTEFGSSCRLPGSFQGPVVVAARSSSFADAVRANIRAAGDQAGRVHCIGALWAAQDGAAAIPADWAGKVTKYAEIEQLVDELLAQRPSS